MCLYSHVAKSLVAQEISSINNAFIILITIIKHCHASSPCMLFPLLQKKKKGSYLG